MGDIERFDSAHVGVGQVRDVDVVAYARSVFGRIVRAEDGELATTSRGGVQGQVGAVRLGLSRAIFLADPATKEALKANGFLTRDPRHVERKKPGHVKARKSPQWSKR